MKTFNILIPVAFFISGCVSTLYFEEPMPRSGEILTNLPDYFNGLYRVQDSMMMEDNFQLYYEINRISNTHCLIFSYHQLSIDSLQQLVEEDGYTGYQLTKETLLMRKKDTTEVIPNVNRVGDFIQIEKRPAFELNLDDNTFYSYDINEQEYYQALASTCKLISYDDKLYINYREKGYWKILVLESVDENLVISMTNISDQDDVMEQYRNISKVENEEETPVYVSNPTDEEFLKIMGNNMLVHNQMWEKVARTETINSDLYYRIGFFIALAVIMLLLLWKRTN